MTKRQKLYKAGQKQPGGKRVDKGTRQGPISSTQTGKTHPGKSLRLNHNRKGW